MFELDRILFLAINATPDTPQALVQLAVFTSNLLPWLALCALLAALAARWLERPRMISARGKS